MQKIKEQIEGNKGGQRNAMHIVLGNNRRRAYVVAFSFTTDRGVEQWVRGQHRMTFPFTTDRGWLWAKIIIL